LPGKGERMMGFRKEGQVARKGDDIAEKGASHELKVATGGERDFGGEGRFVERKKKIRNHVKTSET